MLFRNQYKDIDEKRLIGISTEIVRAIQKKVGDRGEIKVYPWTRAVKIVSIKKNTALFSMLRTPEREHRYKWVGPLIAMKMVFFKKKGSPITLKSLEDAKKVGKIGVAKGVGNFEILQAKGFKNLDTIPGGKDIQNIRKLVKGRIDLWPTPLLAGLYNSRLIGLGGEIVPIKNVVIFSGDMYLAFNKNTDDKTIQKWQNALEMLKKENIVEKIIRRYE